MLQVDTFDNLAEAARSMTPESRYLGGGTLVMRAVNYGDQSFRRIVRLRDQAALRQIRTEGQRIAIGAGVTMADIIASRDLAFLAPVAQAVGGPAVRNMATVGGNLFAPHPYGDLTTALLALDGMVRMADGSERQLEELLAARERVNGLVASVSVMRPTGDEFRFHKVSRVKPKGVSVMSMAAWLQRSGGRLSAVRVAYGAMAGTPIRATAVEQALDGASLDAGGIRRALDAATQGLEPPDDALASSWYRREVAPVHLKRLLLREGPR
ncbi:MAG: FAD binding domain-containing protein [Pseudomonadota bacterium]